MLVHVVAHTLHGQRPFRDATEGEWAWQRLREAFGDAIAACLMPDHLHLITEELAEMVRRLGAVLSGLSRRLGASHLWRPIPPPAPIPDVHHLRRQVRYVLLNPCRAKIVADPLSYPFSTHRGVIGAELDPWVSAERLARACRWRLEGGFESGFHAYVSGDPVVHPNGTPFPKPAPRRDVPVVPLGTVVAAARAASRWCSPAQKRRTIASLAMHQGWGDSERIAQAVGITESGARRILQRVREEPTPEAALFCLGDARLR
jgi:hypothetical protein